MNSVRKTVPADANEECRRIAVELGRPLCDVRWLEGNAEPEVYMAGGVWLPVEMVREMKAKVAQ